MSESTGVMGVTGVTGHLGGRVRELLTGSGHPLVLLARTPHKVTTGAGEEVRACDFADREGAVQALRGVDTLLMVSASEAVDRLDQHRAFVSAAAEAGVRHVVYTSFQGPHRTAPSPSAATTGRPKRHCGRPGWRGRSCGTASTRTSSR